MFLLGMVAIFCLQLLNGLHLIGHAHDASAAGLIEVLVAASLFVGIGRSWELIGGPTIGLASEVTATVAGGAGRLGRPLHDCVMYVTAGQLDIARY